MLHLRPKIGVYALHPKNNKRAYIGVTTDGDRTERNAMAALRRGSKAFPFNKMLHEDPASEFVFEMLESFDTPDAEAIEAAAIKWAIDLSHRGVSLYYTKLKYRLGPPTRAYAIYLAEVAAYSARQEAKRALHREQAALYRAAKNPVA
jgi:hypothetical protein